MTLHDDNKGLQHYTEEVAQMETGVDTAEMWQPARLRKVHPHKSERVSPTIDAAKKARAVKGCVVRIREVELRDPELIDAWRREGCDSERTFLVHPEDCGCPDAHICEHEILTD